VAITVAELVAVPQVRMRFLAGTEGGHRQIAWAHSSDLPNATDWLAPGDLLMSNGLNVPAAAGGQVSFVEELESVGLSGLAIGDGMEAPPLSPRFLARADDLRFPVLAIPHEVPFESVSQSVASANSDEDHERLQRTVRLYETLREAVSENRLGVSLLREFEVQLGCRIFVLDTATGVPVLITDERAPAKLFGRVVDLLRKRDGVFAGVLRVQHEEGTALVIRVPAARPTALVALAPDGHGPDLQLLGHASNIAALEVARVTAEREQEAERGRELLDQLLDRRLEPASALRRFADHEISVEDAVIVAARCEREHADGAPDGQSLDADLHHKLVQRGIRHLAVQRHYRVLVLLADTAAGIGTVRKAVGPGPAMGVSDRIGRPDRVPDAAREAGWAEAAANNLGRPLVRYGESTPLFLPRTLGEAEAAANHVLGPLIAYDEAQSTELIRSLDVFLDNNRSWQRSAKALFVHKQTLVYRMHRVEELTGRNLRSTADVVQLWLALRAREFVHGEPKQPEGEA
jgi:purine catabolism regulator